nr:hypothetical protein [uncultured bacterium]
MNTAYAHDRRWRMAWLVPVMVLAVVRLAEIWGRPAPHDAVYTYFPAAKRLINEGFAFFLDPESYRMAPLAYIWPALWQLDQDAIRLANGALFLAAAAMLWRTADLLGGVRAALLTAALFVLHPELREYFVAEWMEPFYVAGVAALFLASARLILGTPQPRRWIALGAFGLTMTLLGRPALQLMAPAMLLMCLVIVWWPSLHSTVARGVTQQLAWMIALGLIPALIVVVKNGLLFGLWGLATGSGTGLYLGLNPISQGTEPAYYGLDYDVNALAGLAPGAHGDHLHLAADRFLRNIAIETLNSYTWSDRLVFFARKAWWWLFHHPVALVVSGNELRGIRVFELLSIAGAILVTGGLWLRQGRRRFFQQFAPVAVADGEDTVIVGRLRAIAAALLLLGMLGLLAQLLPVLYNSRYSTGLLEPWLCVLTGVSWALMSRFLGAEKVRDGTGVQWSLVARGRHGPAILSKGSALLLILSFALLLAHPRRIERASMDPLPNGMPTTLLAKIEASAGTDSTNIARIGATSWQLRERPGALALPVMPSSEVFSQPNDNALWRLRFAVKPPDGEKCRHAEVGFTAPRGNQALASPLLNLIEDGAMHEYVLHATQDLRPAEPGDLRIAYHCPVGTIVTWGGGEMVRPDVRERWLTLAPSAE